MKLYKALKIRKSLLNDIAKLKQQIKEKNSYIVGSINGEKISVDNLYDELLIKIDKLTEIKLVINEANREIQSKIYVLAEYKALIAFWSEVSVTEGVQSIGYTNTMIEYMVHYDETKRDEIIKDFQKRVDALQEEIDMYNYTTEVSWNI